MTPRTPQCEVFWAFLLNSKHSGVPEDFKSPTLEVLGFTPTLGQSGVATFIVSKESKPHYYNFKFFNVDIQIKKYPKMTRGHKNHFGFLGQVDFNKSNTTRMIF
jgi:hypothetical protein